MHALFIGKRFYTNRDALEENYGRIFQLPFWWADGGHDVNLWLVDYHTREFRARRDGKLSIESTPVFGWRFFRRVFGGLLGSLRRNTRPGLIMASGDCYVGLLGYAIARFSGARFVFDLYDRYDVFAGYRRFPGFDPQTFLLRRADAVTFASNALRDDLQREARATFVVPNGVDRSRFRPLPKAEAREQFGLPSTATLIGYFGSMEAERGIVDLIAAVATLRDDGVNAELVVGGQANADVDLERPWLHYLGNVEFSRVPMALASCDVLTLPYRNSPFLDNASSCKIAEYIAAERPIVATRTPNFVENFPQQAEELSDLVAKPGDVSDLVRCLRQQLGERRLVSMPEGMDWQSISEEILSELARTFGLPVA